MFKLCSLTYVGNKGHGPEISMHTYYAGKWLRMPTFEIIASQAPRVATGRLSYIEFYKTSVTKMILWRLILVPCLWSYNFTKIWSVISIHNFYSWSQQLE